MLQNSNLEKFELKQIVEKIKTNQRIDLEEGEKLLAFADIHLLGHLAHQIRVNMHGLRTTYVLNQQINYTNICINKCLFCSYHRDKCQDKAFEMTLKDIENKVELNPNPIQEIHIVGGCHPDLRLSYYQQMLKRLKQLKPEAILKCFTPVEIDHFAQIEGLQAQEVLIKLKQAGLDMLPGGGAEIFAPKIRKKICPKKISGAKWLEICGQAHELGIKTNCTMLFGHLESRRDRLEHLHALRKQQDKTHGFVCFIPLPFQAQNNRLERVKQVSGLEELKTIAISRLMLDNIPHIKSYWVMLGLKQAQAALYFGADDLDGTVVEEKIGHMAGADSPQVLARSELEQMISGCGFEPLQRNGLFEPVDFIIKA